MSQLKQLLIVALILISACEIKCKRTSRSHGRQEVPVSSHSSGNFVARKRSVAQHPLEGESASSKVGSAPTALDSRFNSQPRDQGPEQVNNRQAVNPLLSPNPQKPSGWNTGYHEPLHKLEYLKMDLSTFHHQGHLHDSDNILPHKIKLYNYPKTSYPNTGSYNYYGVGTSYNYGNGYQYDPQQPFRGYHPTSNVGVIPPKGVDTADYYGSMIRYANNNSGVFGKLFGGQNQGAAYDYGNSGFGNNAYKNVLAGLLIWNMMNGLSNFRYNVYNYYNQPDMIPKNSSLSADFLTKCSENVTMLCETNTKAICTNNGSIFCIFESTEVCGNKSRVNCIGDKKCVTNITIFGKVDLELVEVNDNNSDNGRLYCVATFAVPQVLNVVSNSCKSGICSSTHKNQAEVSFTTIATDR